MTFEKALKRIIDKRIERMDEIFRMEDELYKEMKGKDLEMFVVEEPEKIRKELIKLEKPFLSEVKKWEFHNMVLPVLKIETHWHSLLLECIDDREEEKELVEEFIEQFSDTVDEILDHTEEELIPFLERHGIDRDKFLDEFLESEYSDMLMPEPPLVKPPVLILKKNWQNDDNNKDELIARYSAVFEELVNTMHSATPETEKSAEQKLAKLKDEMFKIELEDTITILNHLLKLIPNTFSQAEEMLEDYFILPDFETEEQIQAAFDEVIKAYLESLEEFYSAVEAIIRPFCNRHELSYKTVLAGYINGLDNYTDLEEIDEKYYQ